MSSKFIFEPAERRMEALRRVSSQAGLTMSELLRRMMDHCFQERVVNELVPAMSGTIVVADGRKQ